ncbi:10223_t:CDS:2, partial [Cetraspora pellucida]
NRRERDSGMVGCSWHVNLSFPKMALGVRINSIVDEHNHPMNLLIVETALRFRRLTDDMLEKLDRCSRLTDVVKEIQETFDKQSKRALVNEFKNEIATRGLPNVMEEYFPEMSRLLREYLTPQIFQKQSDQMSQSLCYDVFLVDNWSMLLEKSRIDQQIHSSVPMYQIVENTLSQLSCQPLLFNHISDVRKTEIIKHKQGPKQKYGFGMGYAKKALDYAIRANKVCELVSYLERFIEDTKGELDKQQDDIGSIENLVVSDPICAQHKGRQPNRYKLEGEVLYKKNIHSATNSTNQVSNENELAQSYSSNSSSSKRVRHCQKCKQ